MNPLCNSIAQAFWPLLGAGCSLLPITWQLYRRTKYLRAALALEQRSNIERQNALVKTLAEAFSRGPDTSLEDLLESAERDFELRSSPKK